MALPYMPSQRTSSGLGRSISTRIIRSASSARAIRARVPVNDRPSRASTLTTAVSPTLVRTTSPSGTRTTTRIMSVRLTVRSGCCPPSVAERIRAPRWNVRWVTTPSKGATILA